LAWEEGPQDWSERSISVERKRAEQAAQDARAQLLEAKEQEEKNGTEFAAGVLDAVMASSAERIQELEDRLAELDRLSLKALTGAQDELDEIRNTTVADLDEFGGRTTRHCWRAKCCRRSRCANGCSRCRSHCAPCLLTPKH
jgi:hypothetical protein